MENKATLKWHLLLICGNLVGYCVLQMLAVGASYHILGVEVAIYKICGVTIDGIVSYWIPFLVAFLGFFLIHRKCGVSIRGYKLPPSLLLLLSLAETTITVVVFITMWIRYIGS